MLRILHVFVFSICTVCLLSAQESGLQGFIRDAAGEPLSYASIYVNETGSGTVSNLDGEYQLRLDPGDYTVIFQYLGYDTHVEKISIGNRFRELNVALQAEALELNTIDVVEGSEDPAYTVMRKAIAKADYHRQQVDYYQARVYIKGSGRLIKSPFFARKALAKEGIDSTVAFTSESVSIIEYERPHTFRERVISVYTQGNDNSVNANSYINGSFYEPTIAEAVSPLNPRAFAYYKFQLEGYFQDRGYAVNKIRVTPRSRGDDVFSGFIYIVEDQWSIHSLELETYKLGIKFAINQVYAPIQEAIWLPVNATFDITGSILGFKFEYGYLATLADYEVRENPDLTYDFSVIDEKIDRELAKEVSEKRRKANRDLASAEEKLAAGEELTRKELRKVMREYERQEIAEERAASNEPPVDRVYEYNIDSLAGKRDSTYWEKIRPVPLTALESKGYQVRDSMARVEKEKTEEGNDDRRRRKRSGPFSPLDILTGADYRLAKGRYIFYESPLQDVQFNPAEGYHATAQLGYRANGEKRALRTGVDAHYAFARGVLNYRGYSRMQFGDEANRDSVYVAGGRYIAQYNEDRPVIELFNTFYALFFERNYVRVFEKDFGQIAYGKRWSRSANLVLHAQYAQRRPLVNRSDQTYFNRDDREYAPNFPAFAELPADTMGFANTAFVAGLHFEWRPWQQYELRNGKRRPRNIPTPAFTLQYRKGIPNVGDSQSDFDQVDFTFQHKFNIGVRGKIDMKVNAGTFLNNNFVAPTDFKHFPGNRMVFTSLDPVGSFRLLPYYRHSTRQEYATAGVHYQFRKFLLTRIWEIQLLGLRENLFANYLYTPTSQNYFEVGYTLDNILRLFRLEVATAWQDGRYVDWGIRVGVASTLLGGVVRVQ